jgi:aminodeoxyfutalosine synthase
MDALLHDIAAKLAAGRRLEASDVDALAAATDIVSLGMLADTARRRRHGARATFVRVAHVRVADAAAGSAAWPAQAAEVRLEGPIDDVDEAVGAVGHVAAAGVPVTGFSLGEMLYRAGGDLAQLGEWLARLAGAGLSALAAAPIDAISSPATAAGVVAASGLGIRAWTVEGDARGDLLAPVRALQEVLSAGHAVRAFAPLPRRQAPEPTTGYADVKAVALARILLDVPHIQVDWMLHGPKLAQVALTFGADDVDNVSPAEESADGRRRAPLEEIRRNIVAAGLEPVERDGRFGLVA